MIDTDVLAGCTHTEMDDFFSKRLRKYRWKEFLIFPEFDNQRFDCAQHTEEVSLTGERVFTKDFILCVSYSLMVKATKLADKQFQNQASTSDRTI